MDIKEAKKVCKILSGKKNKNGKREYKQFSRLNVAASYSLDEIAEAIETVLNQLEKNDKVIDRMTEYMIGLDIDEDVCKHVAQCRNEENDDVYKNCKECLKDFFSKERGE